MFFFCFLYLRILQLIGDLFKESQRVGEIMVSEGIITLKDIEDAKSNKDSGDVIISIGLPAYCIYQSLLRSAKANCAGILLSEYKFCSFFKISHSNLSNFVHM